MRWKRVVRLLALGLPTLATAFFWLMVIGSAFGPDEFTGESLAVLSAAIVLATGTIIAWRRPRWGGPALIGAAAFFATVIATTAGTNVLAVTILLPMPWLVGGLLLLGLRLSAEGWPGARKPPSDPTRGSGPSGGSHPSAPVPP